MPVSLYGHSLHSSRHEDTRTNCSCTYEYRTYSKQKDTVMHTTRETRQMRWVAHHSISPGSWLCWFGRTSASHVRMSAYTTTVDGISQKKADVLLVRYAVQISTRLVAGTTAIKTTVTSTKTRPHQRCRERNAAASAVHPCCTKDGSAR